MNLYKDLDLFVKEDIVNAIIEIPYGSMVKYEFNKEFNVVEVDRFLTAPMPMPYNYGFLPQTYNEDDKDPLDIIVLSSYPLVSGCIVRAKVIGVLHMIDSGEKDDKIISVAYKDPFYTINDISELHNHTKNHITFFLENYKKLEGKEIKLEGFSSKEKGLEIIKKCYEDFKKHLQ